MFVDCSFVGQLHCLELSTTVLSNPGERLNIKCEDKTSFGKKHGHRGTHRIKVQNSCNKFEFCLEVL